MTRTRLGPHNLWATKAGWYFSMFNDCSQAHTSANSHLRILTVGVLEGEWVCQVVSSHKHDDRRMSEEERKAHL